MLDISIILLFVYVIGLYFVYSMTKNKDKKGKFIINQMFFSLLILTILGGLLLAPYHSYEPNVDGGMYSINFYLSIGLSIFFLISYLLTVDYDKRS